MTKPTKEDIVDLLYNNYSDYYTLPHYGLIPSIGICDTRELHNIVLDYLEGDSNEIA